MKQTPLYEKHHELKGKIIEFGGWMLPVEYSGIISEHEAVRNAAGLFDVSHMGEIFVTGSDAEQFIQSVVTNDISKMVPGQIYYSPMCYPDGGVVDDLLIYKYSSRKYLLVVNASNTEKDFEWLKAHKSGDIEIVNRSQDFAQLAVQGPKAQEILQRMTDKNLDEISFFYFDENVELEGISVFISRNGYTGEDGFEILVHPDDVVRLWDLILREGKEDGLLPAGLGARDTLRFEACLPLYGHEINQEITPLEAGLGYFVKLDKHDFIGKEALANQKSNGLTRVIYAFEMIDRGIPRANYEIFSNGKKIGHVTTGSYSPTLKKNIGLALIDSAYAAVGTEIEVSVRNKLLKAKTVKKPFYKKKYKK